MLWVVRGIEFVRRGCWNNQRQSKKLDLRFCWQYIKGEAVDTDQETENSQVGRFQIGAQLAQVR